MTPDKQSKITGIFDKIGSSGTVKTHDKSKKVKAQIAGFYFFAFITPVV